MKSLYCFENVISKVVRISKSFLTPNQKEINDKIINKNNKWFLNTKLQTNKIFIKNLMIYSHIIFKSMRTTTRLPVPEPHNDR